MKSRIFVFLPHVGALFLGMFFLSGPAKATVYNVSNNSGLSSALAGVNPGDSIVMAAGNYSGFTVTRSGTAANPITIQSASLGVATNNTGIIKFSAVSNVILFGLTITSSGGSLTVDGTSRSVGVVLTNCVSCRVTHCNFKMTGIAGGTAWVMIGGPSYSNRVDHCDFGPNSIGNGTHFIWPVGNATIAGVTAPSDRMPWALGYGPFNPNMARYTMVDHNYFHDQASGVGEIMVLGAIGDTGDYQDGFTTVEYNLFVNCNGDPEIISSKSSGNTLRYNTVRTSAGVFSLRAGNHSSIYGNFFLCGGTGGGVKMSERDHRIFNNYIENGDGSNYPIMSESGDLYNVGFAHAEVMRAQIVHNTIVNCGRYVLFAHSGSLPDVDCTFANNIISQSGTLYSESVASLNQINSSNLVFTGSNPNRAGFFYLNPNLTGSSPQRLSGSGAPINNANTNYFAYVTDDMDGQARGIPRDIGADEYFSAGTFQPRNPLTASEVGPNAVDTELSASPAYQAVGPGATNVNFTIAISSDAGFSSPVTLSVNGLLPGITAGFNPPTVNGSGTTTLSITNSSGVPGGNYSFTVTATSGNLASGTAVNLQVGRLPQNLRWSSTGSGVWDNQNSANWLNVSSNTTDIFYNGDTVLMDDTAGVQTSLTIPANNAVAPVIFTNNSSANNFTISGAGKITGATKFVKTGTSTLTLNTTNDFSGGMTVAGGTLVAGNPYALGGQSGFIIVTNGATLDLNGNNLGMDSILVSGAGVGGNGAIVNGGADVFPAFAVIELAGNTTIGGAHRWDLRAPGGDSADPTAASLSTSGNGYSLTKVGTNFVGIVSVTVDSKLGNINIQGGTLDFEGNTTCMGNPNSTLTVYTNATLEFYNDTYGTNLNKVVVLNAGATIQNGTGANTFLGPISLNGNDTFNIGGTSLTLSNNLSGSGNLIKTGGGSLLLNANNTAFTGNTIVSNGTLTVNGAIAKNQQITLAPGATLSVPGTVVTGAGGIVSSGSGNNLSVSGALIATNGTIGTLAAPVGTLSLNNATLQFAVAAGTTNACVGTLTPGGAGNTINISSLPAGAPAQYPLIKYSALGAPFNFTLGPLPGGNLGYLSNNAANLSVDLVISPSTFSLSATPSTQTAANGGATVNYTLTLATNSGFAGSVTFSVGGLPANTASGFTPASLSAPGTSTFSVTTSNTTPVGAYPLVITGVNSASTNSTGVTLIVGRAGGANLEWASSGSTAWDVTNSYNWFNFGGSANDQFYNGDSVTFDDTATVTGITIGAGVAVMPSAVTNLSSDNNFTISGAGKISGATGIIKDGASTLTLGTTNDFTGGVTILNGIVRVGCTNGLGVTGGNTVVQDGGTLDLNGFNLMNESVTVGGGGLTNGGALVNNGAQQTVAFHSVTLSDDTTFGGAGRWDMRSSGGAASLNMTPPNSDFSIIKIGTNQVSLVGVGTIDPTLGDIDIQQGTFAIQTSTVQVGDPTRTITIHGGATLDFYTLSTPLNKNVVIQDGGTIFNEKGPSYMGGGGTITLQGNAIFSMANNGTPPSVNCSNVITGPGNLTVTNGGTLTLCATNTYTGSTLVVTGKLALASSGSISNSALINLAAAGTLEVSALNGGTFTVNAGQALTGNGVVNGNLAVNSNGVVSPGTGGIGMLTVTNGVFLNGTALMKLNKTARTNDVIFVSTGASLTYAGGILMVTNLGGALAVTDSFRLFNAPAYSVSGALPQILPAIPALNLAWNTNTLATDGTLRITNAPTASPQFTASAMSGAGFVFSGASGPAGYPYTILATTNVALPPGQWTPLATNQFGINGGFSFTNFPGTNSPQMFYRLQLQ